MKNPILYSFTNAKDEDELFNHITKTFKDKITTWEYFVNWNKVIDNVEQFEKELNILNYLIGKENLELETFNLIKRYPEVISAFPALLAIRGCSIDILVDTQNFIYQRFNFAKHSLNDDEIRHLSTYIIKSGLGNLIENRRIKNFVDYVMGVEVGLDSNGRKNRGGTLMEELAEIQINKICKTLNIKYLKQANASKIRAEWNIPVQVDKSSRVVDFVIKNNKNKLFFIEVNFYNGGGSKLKATATEYTEMFTFWKKQGFEFIWITDGGGWITTLKPLREYFDKADYLLNLELIKTGVLEQILQ